MYQTGMLRALTPTRLLSGVGILAPARTGNPHADRSLGGRVAPYRRDENPTPATWMLIMGATAAVVGGGLAWHYRNKRSSPPVIGPGGSSGGGGGGSTGTGGGAGFVGIPGYSWPHRDEFETETDILYALAALGYNVGDWDQPICPQVGGKAAVCKSGCTSVICKVPFEGIKQFQRDWNLFSAAAQEMGAENAPGSVGPADGKLGDRSMNALWYAWTVYGSGQIADWQDIMDNVRAQAGVS